MKTSYILTRKDFLRIWPFVAAWAATLFMYYIFPIPIVWSDRMLLTQFLPITVGGAGIVLISFIIHNNPPSGTTEFWMTRPISGPRLFANKLMVVFLVCVLLPVLVLALARITGLAGAAWAGGAHARAFNIAAIPRLLVVALCFMLIASLTQNMKQYISVIFCIFMAFAILMSATWHKTSPQKPAQIIQYSNALEWTLIALSAAGLACIIHNQYTRRNRKATLILSAILALVLYGVWRLWPVVWHG